MTRREAYLKLRWGVGGPATLGLRLGHLAAIAVGVGATAWATTPDLSSELTSTLNEMRAAVLAIFTVEYLARAWTAPEGAETAPPWTARVVWMTSGMAVVDLLALAPWLPLLAGGSFDAFGSSYDDLCAAFWIVKLAHHVPEQAIVVRVLANARVSVLSVLTIFAMIMVIAAVTMHLIEGTANPAAFGTLPKALWWAVVTLTTTGYGDEVPLTVAGRIVASAVMVCGISVLAILAGILVTGYAQEARREEFLRTWRLVASVPFFKALPPSAIAEITGILKASTYPAGAAVVRVGDPGDKMFFIAEGEVEVRLKPEPVRLKIGDFFGELALITQQPRGATVATVTSTTLLALDVADFLILAGRLPELTEAIEAAGKQRLEEDKDMTPV